MSSFIDAAEGDRCTDVFSDREVDDGGYQQREPNARDSGELEDPAVTFASLHKSVSWGTSIVDAGNVAAPHAAVATATTSGR